jgi:DNA-binding SARP family transcriptional activator
VDAARFERLVERARAEAEQGVVDGSAQSALELWRGAPLADVAEEPFAAAEIRRLEELHLRATELAIDAALAMGRHREVVGRLEALVAEHPLHKRFHAQRMLALFRAGRQSEATEAFRAASRSLVEEVGVGPGSELRELQDAILRQGRRPRRAPAPAGAAAPVRRLSGVNLCGHPQRPGADRLGGNRHDRRCPRPLPGARAGAAPSGHARGRA